MRRARHVFVAVIGLTITVSACGAARLPRPPLAKQPTSALAEVPYPPPPARVEVVPKQPQRGAVWIDGEWRFRGRLWWWRSGKWVIPPENATYSPWTSVRSKDGTLYFAPGMWRNASGEELESPKAIARGTPNLGEIVDPAGEIEETGLGVGATERAERDGGP